jgi:hypothetical protein
LEFRWPIQEKWLILTMFTPKKNAGNPLEPALCVSGLNVLLMGFQNLVSDCPYLSVNPGYKIGKSAPKMGRRFVQITKYPRGRAERF